MVRKSFECPICGATVPAGAASCPECGSCEQTGWSDQTYLDGIELPPDPEEDPDERAAREFLEREFGTEGVSWKRTMQVIAAVGLVLLLLWIWVF